MNRSELPARRRLPIGKVAYSNPACRAAASALCNASISSGISATLQAIPFVVGRRPRAATPAASAHTRKVAASDRLRGSSGTILAGSMSATFPRPSGHRGAGRGQLLKMSTKRPAAAYPPATEFSGRDLARCAKVKSPAGGYAFEPQLLPQEIADCAGAL